MTKELIRGDSYAKISCRECGSRDGLQVFYHPESGTLNGFCYACPGDGRFVRREEVEEGLRMGGLSSPADPITTTTPVGERRGRGEDERERTDDDTSTGSCGQGDEESGGSESYLRQIDVLGPLQIPDRKIKESTVRHFGVKVKQFGGEVTHHFYPDHKNGELCGYEVKECASKRFSAVGDRRGALDLWGQHLAKKCSNKKLFITEGRLDAMALWQTLVDFTPPKWKQYLPAVVSVTRGAGSALKDIINNRKFVESFQEVILVFDNDEPGRGAVEKILKTFPSFKVAELPLKDANDMILAGREKELNDLVLWKSQVVRQGQVVDVRDFIEDALIRPKMGIPWPWPTATALTYGLRPHTIHIVGAAPKIGKSDHEYQLIQHLAVNLKIPVGVFDFENPPRKTAKKVASKTAGMDFTRPDVDYDDRVLRERLMELDGIIRFYDRGASREWEDVRVAIEEMHLLDGINIFTIDPLTAFISRYTASEANDRLNEIATDMADLVQKYPITIICYSHVNPKPKGTTPHERGGSVLSSEFTGSRAMEKWFHYGWGIQRDRSPDCPPDRKNISEFVLLFDRDFGESGKFDVLFNPKDCSYLEPSAYERRFAPTGD